MRQGIVLLPCHHHESLDHYLRSIEETVESMAKWIENKFTFHVAPSGHCFEHIVLQSVAIRGQYFTASHLCLDVSAGISCLCSR